MKLTDLSVTDLLHAFRSPEPTPGGGSAAALVGAVGAALLAMVGGLAHPRTATEEEVERLAAARVQCGEISDRLATLIDLDSAAYDRVVESFRLPKATDEDKRLRQARIQEAMRTATEVPVEVMRACGAAIEQGAVVAAFGNRHASSDLQVGLELLAAGLRGAKLNVDINLASLSDAALVQRTKGEAERLAAEADAGVHAAHVRLTTGE
jgi:formiminotetrahydrofolate cyclodeaminase